MRLLAYCIQEHSSYTCTIKLKAASRKIGKKSGLKVDL
jgi:hypothetical protein